MESYRNYCRNLFKFQYDNTLSFSFIYPPFIEYWFKFQYDNTLRDRLKTSAFMTTFNLNSNMIIL